MDMFEWVIDLENQLYESGEEKISDLLAEFPSWAYHGKEAQVEAAYPELLNFARRSRLPWMEVFVRHWYLQTYLESGKKLRELLPEAVDLLAFASKEETRDCPQSVCAVQDICISYGKVDGPAYGEERIAAVDETLARIDPGRGCFDCLTIEKAAALNDLGRPVETVAFMQDQIALARDFGLKKEAESHFLHVVVVPLIEAHILAGEYEEALKWCDRSRPKAVFARVEKSLNHARILLGLERPDEALAVMPRFKEVQKHIFLGKFWAEVCSGLVAAGRMENRWELGVEIKSLLKDAYEAGCFRHAFEMGVAGARLAEQRGAAATLRIHLHYLRQVLDELRAPLGADETLAGLEGELVAMPAAIPADDVEAVSLDDPEAALDSLLAARSGTAGKVRTALDRQCRQALRMLDETGEAAEALLAE